MKELPEIIRVLYDASVEFILIGGVAMNLQGVAYLTQDIDFCYSRTPENLKRLARALEPYHARLPGAPPGLPFRLDAATLQQGKGSRGQKANRCHADARALCEGFNSNEKSRT